MLRIREIDRVVILGNKGFIGRYLETFFLNENPEIKIIGKDLPITDLTNYDNVIPLKGIFDMRTAVIMCSAIKKEYGDNLDNLLKNVQMAVNVSKLLLTNPVRRFIFFSSASVYGEEVNNLSITEDTQINPTSYYGIAKYCSERLLLKSASTGKSELIIIRPPVIYGPGDNAVYCPSGFIRYVLKREKITLWGDGREKREFIFIDDVVKLVNNLIFIRYQGILNIASSRSYSFLDIINILSHLTNSKIGFDRRERTKNKVEHGFINKRLLDVFPEFKFTPLEEGLKKTYEHEKLLCLQE